MTEATRSNDLTPSTASAQDDGQTLLEMTGYLDSIYAALVEAINDSSDYAVGHKLVLAKAMLAQVGLQIDRIGARLANSQRLGVFDDLQMG